MLGKYRAESPSTDDNYVEWSPTSGVTSGEINRFVQAIADETTLRVERE
jgi:hypothetical protein